MARKARYTCIMDPLVLEMAQKVVKSVQQGRVRSYNPVAFARQPAETNEYKPGIHGCLRKQPQEK